MATTTTTTVKKVTKAQRFADIRNMLKGEAETHGTTLADALAFIDKEMELLAKKNSGTSKKQTATQKENEGFKELIKEFLITHSNQTVTQIMKGIPELTDLSNQKVSRLCRDLVESNELVKSVDKGRSLFSLSDSATFNGGDMTLEPGSNDSEDDIDSEE